MKVKNKNDLFDYVTNLKNGFDVDNYRRSIDTIGKSTYLIFQKNSVNILFEIETDFPYSLSDLKLLIGASMIRIKRFLVYSE